MSDGGGSGEEDKGMRREGRRCLTDRLKEEMTVMMRTAEERRKVTDGREKDRAPKERKGTRAVMTR